MTNRDFIGKTLGPYKLEAQLGQGGMASVYRAFQASVKRYVAIKVMSADIAGDPGFVERFEREAQVIAALEHPHILPIIDYGTVEDIHYLVMRYLDGGSLDQRMRRQALSLDECATLLNQVASALDYAHRRGVVHRDIKPNNIMLDGEGNAYLTDFGIARIVQSDHKLTATGSVMGTPAYMSPEQGMGRPVDARSDIYTLGVVLYEMVLNQLPFKADTSAALIFQHVYERPTPPKQINPALPDAVSDVLERALAKNPDDRYQSAGELASAFADATHGRVSAPPADSMGTIVGGPIQPVIEPVRKTPGAARPVSPAAGPIVTGPRRTPTAVPPPPGEVPAQGVSSAPERRSPVPLIIGVVVAIVLLGGGGFLMLMTTNNNNATATAQAIVGASQTQVAFVANQTNTATLFTKTPTPTATFTATNTPTNTPNATQTAQIEASSTALAQSFMTSTALQAQLVAAQNTQTAQVRASSTALALAFSTATALQAQLLIVQSTETAAVTSTARAAASSTASVMTATAQRQMARQTATALKALTLAAVPTDTPTKRAVTATLPPVPTTSSDVQDLLASLQSDGVLASTEGTMIVQNYSFTQNAAQAGFDYWQPIDNTDKVIDFVASADVIFDTPGEDSGCGILARYTPIDANTRTFYALLVYRDGSVKTYVHDKSGYRNNVAYKEAPSSAIETASGSTNHVVVVGIGDKFTIYVNDTQVLSFNEKNYKSGSVGMFASRGSQSSKLTCQYKNMFVYGLKAGSQASGGTAGLVASSPDAVFTALVATGLVPQTAKIGQQDDQTQVSLSEASKFVAQDFVT
ncbi:MAG TPA: protein kinase, partial [Aggregatilineales bacterium]|nr:protein kinase [Aggregatilineales bacterium]